MSIKNTEIAAKIEVKVKSFKLPTKDEILSVKTLVKV